MSKYRIKFTDDSQTILTEESYKNLIHHINDNKEWFKYGPYECISIYIPDILAIIEIKERLVWKKEKLPEGTIQEN